MRQWSSSSNIACLELLAARARRLDQPVVAAAYLVVAVGGVSGVGHWMQLVPAAVFLQVMLWLVRQWSVAARAKMGFYKVNQLERAEWVKVVPPPHCGATEICRIQRLEDARCCFKFQKIEYVFCEKEKVFKEVEFPIDLKVQQYLDARKGIKNNVELEALYDKFGYNTFDIPLPQFWELYKEHAVAPFFVFQVFCVLLWMLDEYWQYSLFTLFMFVLFEAILVQKRIKTLTDIRNMRARPFPIHVFRCGKWEKLLSTHLVPGDICSVVRTEEGHVCPADVVLLNGTCVVNESLLTGESVPQLKEPLCNVDPEKKFSMNDLHKASVLYAGTRVMMSTPDKASATGIKASPDKGALAYVLRTGFSTTQGNLIRTILFATERVTVNNAEAFVFILCLLVFAIISAGYVLYHGLQDPDRSRYKLMLNCIMIITSVVPPELPMELSLAVNNSLAALVLKRIFCSEPFRIPFAGRVRICCFDKTGTLTSDEFVLKGLGGMSLVQCNDTNNSNMKSLVSLTGQKNVPSETVLVIGGCHSLVLINDQIVGDPMEKLALENLGGNLSARDGKIRYQGKEIEILHRNPFNSALKRMSCIISIKEGNSKSTNLAVVAKGAPEVIGSRLSKIPSGYKEAYMHFSRAGCRVLAMAWKPINTPIESRDEAEEGLLFAGFLILESPLKRESRDSIIQLKNSSHLVKMITGDHVLTACEVARQVSIVSRDCLILHSFDNRPDLCWQSLDDSMEFPFDLGNSSELHAQYDLCVPGSALSILQKKFGDDLNFFHFLASVEVYARVSPSQKEFLLASMKSCGFVTLMCGDGTNDVGALKQAHVGVALIEQDEQKSAPRPPPQQMTFKDFMEKQKRQMQAAQAAVAQPPEFKENLTPEQKLEQRQSQMQELWKSLEEDDTPLLQLGDASIAAPFTSKLANISCVLDIIRQGRCTLVTTLQMYKILALNCLISAYGMSVLYLDGVKLGDTQATCFGMVMAGMYLGMSRGNPVKRLSRERPRDSVFSWYMLLSIVGQFSVHLISLMVAVSWAHPFTPTDEENRAPDGKFKINVLNSVVFLMEASMTLSTFAANYQGRPFMENLSENTLMYRLITGSLITVFLSALDFLPPLTEFLELAPLPSQEFRINLVLLMAFDFAFVLAYERVLQSLFPLKSQTDQKIKRH